MTRMRPPNAQERMTQKLMLEAQTLKAENARLRARVAELEAELRKPERHSLDCLALRTTGDIDMAECNCGIRDVLDAATQGEAANGRKA